MATVSHTPPTATRTTPGPLQLAGQFTLGVLLLVAVGLFGWMLFGRLAGNYESVDAKRAQERYKILADRQTDDYKYLHDQPSWFAKDKGLVRVPIDEAMRMTLPALRAEQPHAAYPIATPTGDNGAPTSPDKGVGSLPNANTNPTASNPTVGHPVPTPAPNPTPELPPGVKSPTEATPAPGAPPVAVPTATPAPSASAAPTAAATPANNVNNPGSAPIPGTQAQPMPTPGPEVTPTPPAQPAPLAAPGASPGTNAPGASPAGTP